jgi:hypothetical protein
MSMKKFFCDHCGSYLGMMPRPTRILRKLTPAQQQVFKILSDRSPSGIALTDLAIEIYGPVRGANIEAQQTAQVLVSQVRKIAPEFGFWVPPLGQKKNATYRLLPMEG